MILECMKYEQLNRIILKDIQLCEFFQFAMINNFEISTQSLQILNSVLTKHPKSVSREFFFIESNITKFIQNINKLIAHGSYVTKRQSVRLLSSLILKKPNIHYMKAYINSPANLKLIMNVLIDKSKNLQLEVFHVFKVMVTPPRKTKLVFDILTKNREELFLYIEKFKVDNMGQTFWEERNFIIQQIDRLPRLVLTHIRSDTASNPSLSISSTSSSSI